ncbi:hypothetical protein OG824_31835 [Streptomyces prunicolor]|uniref:hypothetical protein n=1 Tax=Streptomyces prunicolor TaxID=67348 RepID=UPI0022514F10|nr:hypothetical protein [Streptomyces prunicolor]MCX5239802.1 hypothetical protein [Streptomyces prunicolor]
MAFHTFDRGGAPAGTLAISIDRFGDDYVALDLDPAAGVAHLTAEETRAVAADLLAHADELDSNKECEVHGTPMTDGVCSSCLADSAHAGR